jgi:ankyrin repeat protein
VPSTEHVIPRSELHRRPAADQAKRREVWKRLLPTKLPLARGADPNIEDDDGVVALHVAAVGGHTAVIELLLMHQANINEDDDSGATPLHLAAAYGQMSAVQLLVSRGATVNNGDENGHTRQIGPRKTAMRTSQTT